MTETIQDAAALHQAGRLDEAEAIYRAILEAEPDNPDALHLSGVVAHQRGRGADAVERIGRALELRPDDAPMHNNLAEALRVQGRIQEAVGHYRQAIELDDGFADPHNNLGVLLRAAGEIEAAAASYEAALARRPDFPEAENNLAVVLRDLGRPEDALAHARRAVELRPRYAEAHNNLANALKDLGRLTEAAGHYARAIEIRPAYGQPYSNLAHCRKYGPGDDADIARLEGLIASGGLTPDAEGEVRFALGKMHDDRGEFDAAFAEFETANRLHAPGFERAAYTGFIDGLIATFSADFFAAREGWGVESELPVFIIGLPRSGTSLVEQILASHAQVHGAGELTDIGRLAQSLRVRVRSGKRFPDSALDIQRSQAAPLAQIYLDRLRSLAPEAARITDKMPSNFLYLGFIALLYPKARVIHCRRDARDVGLSCYAQNFSHRPAFAYDLGDIGFYIREYERLMAHWQAVAPVAVLDIDYQTLIAEQESESRALVEFCGLAWDDACLAFHKSGRAVRTASSWQVRQPIYKSSAGRWQNYEPHLGPLIDALAGDGAPAVPAESEAALSGAIRGAPDAAAPRHRLGQFYRKQGRPEEAIACFEAALERDPGYLDALISLGVLREARGESPAAVELYRRALDRDGECYAALVNLANILDQGGEPNEAAALYQTAIATRKAPVEALVNFGNLLTKQGRLKEAVACYERALGLNPKNAVVHNNLANLLKNKGEIEKALDHYRRATELDPDFPIAASNLVFAMNYDGRADGPALFEAHKAWAARWADPLIAESAPHTNDPWPDRRLRVAYLSPDFWAHSVAYFMAPLLECHDRGQVELICYANARTADAMTERLREFADHWRDIRPLTDDQVAGMIRSDGIDILVDLAGHTAGNRLAVFARKPAPVQVAYLGYPATTGMRAMEYRLTDDFADPAGVADAWHSEELVRLPRGFHCFSPPADCPALAPLPARVAGHVTFGSFNNLGKVGEETVALWSAVLAALPDARFVVKSQALADPGTRSDLGARFEARGVDPARLELLGRIPGQAAHLDLYNRVDIALDTVPYNGATTSCEALWMGVPVVSLAGVTHAARVGLSLLANLGLAELVAGKADEFVAIAAGLARDLDRLEALRGGMRERMTTAPITDGAGLARAIEEAYRAMWRRWCAGRSG